MALPTTAHPADLDRSAEPTGRSTDDRTFPGTERRRVNNALSWGAIVAGAAAAAALSLILLILGVGLGLSTVSPWAREGVSATTFGVSTILWLTLTSLLSAGMGGYLAGRLRTRWTNVDRDEVYFRDTAHGFLSWAVASLATGALLTSVIGTILGGGVQTGAALVGGVAGTAVAAAGGAAASAGASVGNEGGAMGYFIDSLFRRGTAPAVSVSGSPSSDSTGSGSPTSAGTDSRVRASGMDTAEVSRIFINASWTEPLPADELRHVGQIVAQGTGLSQQEAEMRVSDVFAKAQAKAREAETAAREAADQARKAGAYSALWLFVSLLVGAFVASLAATFGGRRRDA